MKHRTIFVPAVLAAALGLGAVHQTTGVSGPTDDIVLGNGDIDALQSAYGRWRNGYERVGGSAETLRLPLGYTKGLSERRTDARGQLQMNLMDGSASVSVKGLADGAYEVWAVDNRPGPGRTIKPEAGDGLLKLGSLQRDGESFRLKTQLQKEALAGFTFDMVTVTRAGVSPDQGTVISGSPGLLQRLYYSDKPWTVTAVGDVAGVAKERAAPFEFLLPKPAFADRGRGGADLKDVLGAQIAKGRELFVNETFNGNGRTCATCHRPDNNHTIDPKYIAKLPKNDPLFVAETNPELKDLEKPALMRQFGLILANVDGFDRPGVMRSVPYTLGLSKTIDVEVGPSAGGKGEFDADMAFASAIGWSGDGAPGSGSLREFAIGAVTQHMPKTLNRVPDVDFRLPTPEELDALEAYQLSLGRSEDIQIRKLTFNSPLVEKGKLLFDTKQNNCVGGTTGLDGKPTTCAATDPVTLGDSANCNGCHSNAGAISSTTNANPTRDTGIENMKHPAARLADPSVPVDGGFGTEARTDCGVSHDQPCYGDGRFNTPSLIEAADTAPFFHNNSVNSIEEAVAAYNNDSFNFSPGAVTSSKYDRRVKLDSSQVVAVALFLRSVNVLENIRASNKMDGVIQQLKLRPGREMIKLAMADTEDAIEVMTEAALIPHPDALKKLETAYKLEDKALDADSIPSRNRYLDKAMALKLDAKAIMVTELP